MLVQLPKRSDDEPIQIYADVASAMTGVSLFGQRALLQKYPISQCNIHKGSYEVGNDYDDITMMKCSAVARSSISFYRRRAQQGYYNFVDIAKGFTRMNCKGLSSDQQKNYHFE